MATAKNSHVYEDHIQNRFLSQKQLREQRREGAQGNRIKFWVAFLR